VLGFPYLSVREQAAAAAVRNHNPNAALNDLAHASKLDPLSADPGRTAGAIALQTGNYNEAISRFSQSISREPGGWFAWFGRGLAESALGNTDQARSDYQMAASINKQDPTVKRALARVDTTHPLTPAQAFSALTLVH
jgi:Flp pilus assembly protein TadD